MEKVKIAAYAAGVLVTIALIATIIDDCQEDKELEAAVAEQRKQVSALEDDLALARSQCETRLKKERRICSSVTESYRKLLDLKQQESVNAGKLSSNVGLLLEAVHRRLGTVPTVDGDGR